MCKFISSLQAETEMRDIRPVRSLMFFLNRRTVTPDPVNIGSVGRPKFKDATTVNTYHIAYDVFSITNSHA
jgi:hypothetical protein